MELPPAQSTADESPNQTAIPTYGQVAGNDAQVEGAGPPVGAEMPIVALALSEPPPSKFKLADGAGSDAPPEAASTTAAFSSVVFFANAGPPEDEVSTLFILAAKAAGFSNPSRK